MFPLRSATWSDDVIWRHNTSRLLNGNFKVNEHLSTSSIFFPDKFPKKSPEFSWHLSQILKEAYHVQSRQGQNIPPPPPPFAGLDTVLRRCKHCQTNLKLKFNCNIFLCRWLCKTFWQWGNGRERCIAKTIWQWGNGRERWKTRRSGHGR